MRGSVAEPGLRGSPASPEAAVTGGTLMPSSAIRADDLLAEEPLGVDAVARRRLGGDPQHLGDVRHLRDPEDLGPVAEPVDERRLGHDLVEQLSMTRRTSSASSLRASRMSTTARPHPACGCS